ncbi:MAG: NlpC/P60 family protein, partial [Pseudomonadota bacterium]
MATPLPGVKAVAHPDLDHRTHVYRDDMADARLRDQVIAERYVTGEPHRITHSQAPLYQQAGTEGRWGSELVYGEPVLVFEHDQANGTAWCQHETDGYVGHIPLEALSPRQAGAAPTHRVWAIQAPLFPEADLKTPVIGWRSVGSLVSLTGAEKNRFLETTEGGWLYQRHVRPLDAQDPDYISNAKRFMEQPYIWGGRSGRGLDCSALIQFALMLAGVHNCPRDTDQQRAGLGQALPPDTHRQAGD